MYQGVNLQKGYLAMFFYPITIIRRMIFTLIPYIFIFFPWFQIQWLIVLNFVYTWYYIAVKPHIGRKTKLYQEVHNEMMILVLSYHMFAYSDFAHPAGK